MPLPICCVLFDHDDTLLPTFELRVRCLRGAAEQILGHEVDARAILVGTQGQSLESIALGVARGDRPLSRRLIDAYRDRYLDSGSVGLEPYEGVRETLAALRETGVRVAVVTSKLAVAARRELALTGLDVHVECLVGAEDVARHKPEPEPLLRAMRELGAAPGGTLMVGDTRADVLGARNAGVAAAGALWGTLDRELLAALAPDHLLERPQEILALARG